MIELNDLTIVIPVKIESSDRYNNLKTVLGYINNHFKTNIKIIEETPNIPKIDFLDNFKNLSIDYKFCVVSNSTPYHRTKYLNEMIFSTETKIVSNYDCDVFFPVETYVNVVNKLLNNESDFIYPYTNGWGQKQLFYSNWYNHPLKDKVYYPMFKFVQDFDISVFDNDVNVGTHISSYGHSVFAKTDSYKNAFGENENFISYGPEDQERAYRFKKLGYKVEWYDGFVYHIEHSRTSDSWLSNPFFNSNCKLFEDIKELSEEELVEFYNNQNYLDKYKNNKLNIGLLIICTGKYSIFFESLYKSCEDNFLKNHKKTYYVFTDDDKIVSNNNIVKIHQDRLGWPFDTLKRFSVFNKSKDILLKEDYLYFLNANMFCLKEVGEEIIPTDENHYLTAVQHPGFYGKDINTFTYERNNNSKFYIPYGVGKYYYQGCFIGGRSREFIDMSIELDSLIDEDIKNEIIPVWWDESALNWYYLNRNPLIIDRHYAYPENHDNFYIDSDKKNAVILNRDKGSFGGHDYLRDKNNK